MDENEFKERLNEMNEPVTDNFEDEEEDQEEHKPLVGELPDFVSYLKSEEHIRDGSSSKMPMKIQYMGKDFQVFVRPLTSQEYYRIQLDAVNKKESLDLLACQTAMVDADGNTVDPLLIGDLKAGTIQDISAGIRLISGIDTRDMDYKEIMEYFLKT